MAMEVQVGAPPEGRGARGRLSAAPLAVALLLAAILVALVWLAGLARPLLSQARGEERVPLVLSIERAAPLGPQAPAGLSPDCSSGIAGDMVGDASPHEVFEAYLKLCRGW